MSQPLINLSPDLKALKDDGYELDIRWGHLVIYNVPYVNAEKKVKRGTLVSTLDLSGDVTTRPSTHVASFAGEHPCDKAGRELIKMKHRSSNTRIDDDLTTHHSFSSKPKEGYRDYYHKMTTYVEMISVHAQGIDPSATARTYAVIEADNDNSVFNYIDTASARSGIGAATAKLNLRKIGIVGLGGTGSYTLDLVVKTPVHEIHTFDGDYFLQHNAFRSPGAPTIEELRQRPKKVDYFTQKYRAMRKNIVAHDTYITESNLELLDDMNFVFICIDDGEAKRPIIERLEEQEIPFIDVGMGIEQREGKLLGILRVTASTPDNRDHISKRIGFTNGDAEDIYRTNIQVADLNALNATLAVIKWKKLYGFYLDLENEHSSNYTLDGNIISNTDIG